LIHWKTHLIFFSFRYENGQLSFRVTRSSTRRRANNNANNNNQQQQQKRVDSIEGVAEAVCQ